MPAPTIYKTGRKPPGRRVFSPANARFPGGKKACSRGPRAKVRGPHFLGGEDADAEAEDEDTAVISGQDQGQGARPGDRPVQAPKAIGELTS